MDHFGSHSPTYSGSASGVGVVVGRGRNGISVLQIGEERGRKRLCDYPVPSRGAAGVQGSNKEGRPRAKNGLEPKMEHGARLHCIQGSFAMTHDTRQTYSFKAWPCIRSSIGWSGAPITACDVLLSIYPSTKPLFRTTVPTSVGEQRERPWHQSTIC